MYFMKNESSASSLARYILQTFQNSVVAEKSFIISLNSILKKNE